MVPRQKSYISQISFVIDIKIDQHPFLRSVPRVTTKTNKSSTTIVLSFAVVRGWWSAIVLSFAVVRGWWPAIVLSHLPPKPNFTVQNERFARFCHLPWSGVGGLLLSYHLLWSGVGGQLLFYHICHQNERFARGFLEISQTNPRLPRSSKTELAAQFLEALF